MKTFKFTKARWSQDQEGTWVSFLVTDKRDVLELLSEIKDKIYSCMVKEDRGKRSLDSNAYYWVLMGKLSEKLQIPPTQIYRQHIQDIGGNFDVIPLKDEAVDRFVSVWTNNGIGWVVGILGKSKHDGYTNVVAYYGSSTYDSAQMSRLINNMVEDCAENGIDTMTPSEIEKLNAMWKGGK